MPLAAMAPAITQQHCSKAAPQSSCSRLVRMAVPACDLGRTAHGSTALHWAALHWTALHCTGLDCTGLDCTALHCTWQHPWNGAATLPMGRSSCYARTVCRSHLRSPSTGTCNV